MTAKDLAQNLGQKYQQKNNEEKRRKMLYTSLVMVRGGLDPV